MPKAKIRLFWDPSVSPDITKVEAIVTNNGITAVVVLPPELNEHFIEVEANTAYSFQLKVTDSDGLTAFSTTFNGRVNDLVAPQPPTNLGGEIAEIIPDPVPTPEE